MDFVRRLWIFDYGLSKPFILLFTGLATLLWAFVCNLCKTPLATLCFSPFKCLFMRGAKISVAVGTIVVGILSMLLGYLTPNLCFVVWGTKIIGVSMTGSSKRMSVYHLDSARISVESFDKLMGANCHAVKLIENLDIVNVGSCEFQEVEEGLKGVLSQQIFQTINHGITVCKSLTSRDDLIMQTTFRLFSVLRGEPTTILSTSQQTAIFLFCNAALLMGVYKNRRDFWTYFNGGLVPITIFIVWCLFLRQQAWGWQQGLFAYCTLADWCIIIISVWGECTVKCIFKAVSDLCAAARGAQDSHMQKIQHSTSGYPARAPGLLAVTPVSYAPLDLLEYPDFELLRSQYPLVHEDPFSGEYPQGGCQMPMQAPPPVELPRAVGLLAFPDFAPPPVELPRAVGLLAFPDFELLRSPYPLVREDPFSGEYPQGGYQMPMQAPPPVELPRAVMQARPPAELPRAVDSSRPATQARRRRGEQLERDPLKTQRVSPIT